MKQFSHLATRIFKEAIGVYETQGSVDTPCVNPYPERTIEHDLFRKNWIDNAQWCLEDIIRDPDIDPVEALKIKRRIDRSNQERTDLVELIDSFFLQEFASVKPLPKASINTESPAWAIDRLSILELKITTWTRPSRVPRGTKSCAPSVAASSPYSSSRSAT